jgi:hypothetical protein
MIIYAFYAKSIAYFHCRFSRPSFLFSNSWIAFMIPPTYLHMYMYFGIRLLGVHR